MNDSSSFTALSWSGWLPKMPAAGRMRNSRDSTEPLALRPISELMADFVISLAGRAAAAAWSRRTLATDSSEVSAASKVNALGLLTRMGKPLQEPGGSALLHPGLELSGMDLAGADLHGANLDRADLSGAGLDDADLSGASLRSALLPSITARRAKFTGADLSDADLSRSCLLGAEFRQASSSRGAIYPEPPSLALPVTTLPVWRVRPSARPELTFQSQLARWRMRLPAQLTLLLGTRTATSL